MFSFFLFLLLPAVLTAKQNVLLITIDTLRADHLGSYGDKNIHTPNLDSLAADSLFFQNAVCPAPLTLVSHTSLLTGRYPYHHGVHDNAGVVNPNETTLAEILKQNGYHTYAFISGFPLEHRFGLNQGFDVYNDTFPRGKQHSFLDFRSERTADAVVQSVLANHFTEPYFVWVHFYDPHAPYKHGGYDGEIEFVDQQIGKMLQNWNLTNTIVAVAGDHGESLAEHGEYTHRIFVYDSTMHVPFWIKGPGVPQQKVANQVRLIDFLPTLLSFLKISAPQNVDGVALPVGAGRSAYLESSFPQLELGWAMLSAVRTNDWKYIQAPHPELYNLRTDPNETKNVIAQQPGIVKQLSAQLPDVKENTQNTPVSAELQEQLSSLGYVSGKSTTTSSNIDPKDRIAVWNQIEQAVDLEKTNAAEAVAILEKAQKADPDNPMILGFLARKYAESNRLPEAKQILQGVLARDPKNLLAMRRMVVVCLRLKQSKEANRYATSLLKLDDTNPDSYILLARANIQLQQPGEAITNLNRALQIDPGDVDLRNDLANLYLQQKQLPQARNQFQEILKTDAANIQALNGLAMSDYSEGNLDGANLFLQRAIRSNANDPQTLMNLALLYSKEGKIKEAAELYNRIISSPQTPPDWKTDAQARLDALSQK